MIINNIVSFKPWLSFTLSMKHCLRHLSLGSQFFSDLISLSKSQKEVSKLCKTAKNSIWPAKFTEMLTCSYLQNSILLHPTPGLSAFIYLVKEKTSLLLQ